MFSDAFASARVTTLKVLWQRLLASETRYEVAPSKASPSHKAMRGDVVPAAFPEIVEKALAFYHANQAQQPNAGKQHVKPAPFP